MPVEAVLIAGPAIDFNTLLGLTYKALRRNIAGASDASPRKMVDAEKFLTCLAALRGEDSAITPDLLSHVSFSVLVIADEHDLLSVLEIAGGMSFVHTLADSNIAMAVITGTLAQWKDAVVSGTNEATDPAVRTCYSKILWLLDQAGLTWVWNDYDRRTDRNGFLLEDNRK